MNFKRYHVSRNLFDEQWIQGIYNTINGTYTDASNRICCKNRIEVSPSISYSVTNTITQFRVLYYDINDNFISYESNKTTFTTPSNCKYIRFFLAENHDVSDAPQLMLNTGSQPLPYEPYGDTWHDIPHYIMGTDTDTLTALSADIYANDITATVVLKGNMEQSGTPSPTNPIQSQECGDLETEGAKAEQYKIPILSANTTTPVYLGEVQTTRKIKKLVLTRESDVDYIFDYNGYIYVQKSGMLDEIIKPFCNCLVGTTIPAVDAPVNSVKQARISGFANPAALIFKLDGITTINQFLSFLSTMNSAGTPVTIWYVLAEPTTGIVNEPIRKIGDYADEVSGITIPTIAGANTLSIGTTLQPSEVSVNYHGWHPVLAVHERENGAWT